MHFPTAPLQTFMSSCTCELCTLPVDARSRRHAHFALLTNQRASRGAPRRTFPNHGGELRRSGARARLSVNRRPRGARGRALEKNLKPRELLLLLLQLVAAAKIIETVTSIKIMFHNMSSVRPGAPWSRQSDLNVIFSLFSCPFCHSLFLFNVLVLFRSDLLQDNWNEKNTIRQYSKNLHKSLSNKTLCGWNSYIEILLKLEINQFLAFLKGHLCIKMKNDTNWIIIRYCVGL